MREFNYRGTEKKLSKVVCDTIPSLNFYKFKAIIRKGDVKVNGKKVYEDVTVYDGDNLKIYFIEEKFTPKVVYEDENIVVYYKPDKIPSDGVGSFEEKIKEVFPNYVLSHRLDTNTEGLIIFAKNTFIFNELKKGFKNKKIHKYYMACVVGTLKSSYTYVDYLLKDSQKSKVKIYTNKVDRAEQIITKVKPISHNSGVTYIEVELVTGKTHQIRAHLAYRGFPIVGDGKYGDFVANKRYGINNNQMLVAYKITFDFDDGVLKYLNEKQIIADITHFFKI